MVKLCTCRHTRLSWSGCFLAMALPSFPFPSALTLFSLAVWNSLCGCFSSREIPSRLSGVGALVFLSFVFLFPSLSFWSDSAYLPVVSGKGGMWDGCLEISILIPLACVTGSLFSMELSIVSLYPWEFAGIIQSGVLHLECCCWEARGHHDLCGFVLCRPCPRPPQLVHRHSPSSVGSDGTRCKSDCSSVLLWVSLPCLEDEIEAQRGGCLALGHTQMCMVLPCCLLCPRTHKGAAPKEHSCFS